MKIERLIKESLFIKFYIKLKARTICLEKNNQI